MSVYIGNPKVATREAREDQPMHSIVEDCTGSRHRMVPPGGEQCKDTATAGAVFILVVTITRRRVQPVRMRLAPELRTEGEEGGTTSFVFLYKHNVGGGLARLEVELERVYSRMVIQPAGIERQEV